MTRKTYGEKEEEKKHKTPLPTFKLWNYVYFWGYTKTKPSKIKMLQNARIFRDILELIQRNSSDQLSHVARSTGEAETEREEHESRSINLSTFYRWQFRRTPWRVVLYIYLNKKLMNLPLPSTSQNEELFPLHPRAIFNTKVSSRGVRNSTFGYICTVSFPQS